ncbi:APC family permease [Tunturibacter empetritectus]|uniref:Amino acid transporter n=1 Tax=Tunturiibacter lichenicola TaxID=2051959 RepID=A0A7W8N1J3_9BACT|nr:APC family permease [Edaphobacter lichenicola]MBB5342302.1 amino acid transporter [Edaphobacter lichenicola]
MAVGRVGLRRAVAGGGKMRLLPLIAATYFMVSGGPYGLEDVIGMAGYVRALLLLLVIPVVWSLPTSLMVGELAAAIPEEGGYYRWVRRAMGEFWGFQEAWLSLAASVFDMAIYPTIFVLYMGRMEPAWTAGYRGTAWALGVVVVCMAWNLLGARAVGEGSVGLFCVLLSPFVVLTAVGLWKGLMGAHGLAGMGGSGMGGGLVGTGLPRADWAGAVSVTLWNYMGWDNASTVAQEVEEPQRNYPRAMLLATGLVALTYVLPLAAVGLAGIPAARFSTGAWVDAARELAGPWLAVCVVLGGMINGGGMFNALMMSYTRVPYALAEEGMLPEVMERKNRWGVPWVSLAVCSVGWALALRLSFERLISIDLVLYGAALMLEFVALVVLRVKEPELARPFKVPGGVLGAVGMGVGPGGLIAFALWAARGERVAGLPALEFAGIVAAAGPVVYLAARMVRRGRFAS